MAGGWGVFAVYVDDRIVSVMAEGRTSKTVHNVVAAFIELLVVVVSGLVIPRLIIVHYGSACNGLIASIAKFVSLISVLNVGISGAARAQLYGPLSRGDRGEIAEVVCTMEHTYRRIGFALLIYMMTLTVLYPFGLFSEYDFWFTASLIAIVSITSFARYFVGAPYVVLLYSDQKHSVVSYNRAAVQIVASVAVIIFILKGYPIQAVKLVNSVIVALGTVALCYIARKRYGLSPAVLKAARGSAPKGIPGRRHSIAQGISDYVNSNVDVVLLSLFMTVTDVAVYAVYTAVVSCCVKVIENVISSFGAAFGNMYAKGEFDAMRENIKIYELIVFSLSSAIFATALVMIVPFVDVYTSGVVDADYHQPLFAVIYVLATMFLCFRFPYETVLKAAGHFKQTKPGAYVEAGLNLVLSVAGVLLWGLPGVVLGTLVSAIVRTVEMAGYFGKHLIERHFSHFLLHVALALAICASVWLLIGSRLDGINSWSSWILAAGMVFGVSIALTLAVDWLFYREDCRRLLWKLLQKRT